MGNLQVQEGDFVAIVTNDGVKCIGIARIDFLDNLSFIAMAYDGGINKEVLTTELHKADIQHISPIAIDWP